MTRIHRYSQRFALVLIAAAAAALVFAGLQFRAAHSQSCQRTDKTLDVLTDILVYTEPPPAVRERMTPDQLQQTDGFYRFAYQRINQAHC